MRQHSTATALWEHEPPDLLEGVHGSAGPGGLTARLRVDQGNPFYFDHPLDHVPGMLILCGAADLVRAAADDAPEGRVRGAMTFRSICELEPAPTLLLPGGERGRIEVTQDSETVADGWFEFSAADDVPARDYRIDPGRQVPADAALVHRARDENIMIGAPWQGDGHVTALVLAPPDGHTLAGRRPGAHAVDYLVEAGRQFSTWLPHRLARWPLDAHMLWIGVTVDLPVSLPRTLAVALRWRAAPISADKAKFHLDLIHADGRGPALGSLHFASKMLTPAEYARFRGNGRNPR
ncbi:AfsA-related hotdog domain-containing protein [Actinoplanes sp. NPDC049118]|uniref:AfsA-related hotdog domain-containing protein n=1 Tax=Actinoplanes sp. NPDC049118 TaxID=3155769 RepID=UPI0033C94818